MARARFRLAAFPLLRLVGFSFCCHVDSWTTLSFSHTPTLSLPRPPSFSCFHVFAPSLIPSLVAPSPLSTALRVSTWYSISLTALAVGCSRDVGQKICMHAFTRVVSGLVRRHLTTRESR
eukprot:25737-Pleurochrysis_carterae.AAC.1